MACRNSFVVIQFTSHALRREALNVGILIDTSSGLGVLSGRRLEKLRAISAALNPDEVEQDLLELPELLGAFGVTSVEDPSLADVLKAYTSFSLGSSGDYSSDPQTAHIWSEDLLSRYVNTEPALAKPVKKRATKLRSNILQSFRAQKILARKTEGLDSHRVVYRQPLSQGIVADFALQNGAMHILETVDASAETISLQRYLYEIAMSSFTFEHARIAFEGQLIKPRLVYEASAVFEHALAPSLYAAQHQGAELINWKSEQDRLALLEQLERLAVSTDDGRNAPTLFHASPLSNRALN